MRRLAPALLAGALALAASAAPASVTFDEAFDGLRAQSGRSAVDPDARLSAAAQAHAEDMARGGYFSHQSADGTTMQARAQRAGCRGGYMAENLAWGIRSASEVVSGWMNSPAHRDNMLGRNYRVYGLGESGGIWVLMVADRC